MISDFDRFSVHLSYRYKATSCMHGQGNGRCQQPISTSPSKMANFERATLTK